jgi:hypothetical protein
MATQKIEAQLQGGGTGVNIGEQIKVDFVYSTNPDSKATGFSFSAFFDSTELQFDSFATGSVGGFISDAPDNDTGDSDGNSETDKFLNYGGQTSDFVNFNFPNGTQPLTLATATFTVLEGFDGTPINFTTELGGDSNGVSFTGESVPLNLVLDVDEAPIVASPIADVFAEEDDPDATIDLIPIFTDPDGDAFTGYTVTSSDESKVIASIIGTNLVLDYQEDQFGDNIAITVTATANGKSVSDDFLVNIEESTAPELTKVEGKNLFKVGGDPGNVKLTVQQASSNTSKVGDIKIIAVDDSNNPINDEVGSPVEEDALSAIFRNPDGFNSVGLSRILAVPDELFSEGTNLGISLTTESEEEDSKTISSLDSEFVTITDVDVDGDGIFDVGVFDITFNDGDTSFVVRAEGTESLAPVGTDLEDGSAIIDLSAETTSITFTVDVFREAAFDNIVGIYNIDALTGENLTPGADGFDSEAYINGALDNRATDLLTVGQGNGAIDAPDITLSGGAKYGVFIITDVKLEDEGTVEEALEDARNGDLEIYFPFLGANSDEVSHLKLLGDNVIGIEDLDGGGDQDFNDVIFNFTQVV